MTPEQEKTLLEIRRDTNGLGCFMVVMVVVLYFAFAFMFFKLNHILDHVHEIQNETETTVSDTVER
jgi:hypothetical protein